MGALVPVAIVLVARGLVSPLPSHVRFWMFLVGGGAIAVGQVVLGRCPLPSRQWQIPAEWILGRNAAGAFQFGWVLGAGLFTYVPSCAAHILAIALLLLPLNLDALFVAGVGFAFGRSAEMLARTHTPRNLVARLERGLASRRQTGTVLSIAIVASTFVALTVVGGS